MSEYEPGPYGITIDNLMRAFPEVLKRNPKIEALARLTAKWLVKGASETELCTLYADIDSLPEAVLDILAYDFKVDWYETYFPLETKRQLIKTCIQVHKKQGTKEGVTTAMEAIFDDVAVEEWFEYDGRPYHYQIAVEAEGQEIDLDLIDRLLAIFVPRRCVMGDGGEISNVIYLGSAKIIVHVEQKWAVYTNPLCGTIPYWSTFGRIDDGGILVGSESGRGGAYENRLCGSVNTLSMALA